MSRTDNRFSLFDFCKKQAEKMEIYGEETLDEDGNIIPFEEQAALITHYLQLDRKGVILPYRTKVKKSFMKYTILWNGQENKRL